MAPCRLFCLLVLAAGAAIALAHAPHEDSSLMQLKATVHRKHGRLGVQGGLFGPPGKGGGGAPSIFGGGGGGSPAQGGGGAPGGGNRIGDTIAILPVNERGDNMLTNPMNHIPTVQFPGMPNTPMGNKAFQGQVGVMVGEDANGAVMKGGGGGGGAPAAPRGNGRPGSLFA